MPGNEGVFIFRTILTRPACPTKPIQKPDHLNAKHLNPSAIFDSSLPISSPLSCYSYENNSPILNPDFPHA
jgi:hypothetical protein